MWEKVGNGAIIEGADVILQNRSGGNAAWLNNSLIRSLNSQILVITSDNLMEISLKDIQIETEKLRQYSYLVARANEPEMKGDRIIESEGQVIAISDLESKGKLATGLQIINPSTLTPGRTYDDFHQVWEDLIDKNLLRVSKYQPREWLAIDTPSDLERARKTFRRES
jgi:NDP-sugar pyrophosphorylase family protein